jgi:hypothetical protein
MVEADEAEPLHAGEVRVEGPEAGAVIRGDRGDQQVGDSEAVACVTRPIDPGVDPIPGLSGRMPGGEGREEPAQARSTPMCRRRSTALARTTARGWEIDLELDRAHQAN